MKKLKLDNFTSMYAGLLCNHTAWDIESGSYIFEKLPNLRRIFAPEHGLFAELQDQVSLSGKKLYSDITADTEVVSLYGDDESSLSPAPGMLQDLDVLFVDLQDVGSRYFTYAVTLGYMMKAITKYSPNLSMVLIDRENPAGLQVEGSKLPENFSSFIGWPGLPHRHGLSLAELGLFFYKQISADFPLHILPLNNLDIMADFKEVHPDSVRLLENDPSADKAPESAILSYSWFIPPSPNIPGPATPYIYSGQCLLEGTNLSEGRGTTRPFEQFGAPWLTPLKPLLDNDLFMKFPGIRLRPILFRPAFHKWKNEMCHGFQIHLTGKSYHSLLHSLYMIRTIRDRYPKFEWKEGHYEFGSDHSAIELLAGDLTLLDYLNQRISFDEIREYLVSCEKQWLDEMDSYKIYDQVNHSVLLSQ